MLNLKLGLKVAVLPSAPKDTAAATLAASPLFFNVKVEGVMLGRLIASLNTAMTLEEAATAVAWETGEVVVMVGGALSELEP